MKDKHPLLVPGSILTVEETKWAWTQMPEFRGVSGQGARLLETDQPGVKIRAKQKFEKTLQARFDDLFPYRNPFRADNLTYDPKYNGLTWSMADWHQCGEVCLHVSPGFQELKRAQRIYHWLQRRKRESDGPRVIVPHIFPYPCM